MSSIWDSIFPYMYVSYSIISYKQKPVELGPGFSLEDPFELHLNQPCEGKSYFTTLKETWGK